MYQILSQSVRFSRLYIKKHFGVFFSVHSVNIQTESINCNLFYLLTHSTDVTVENNACCVLETRVYTPYTLVAFCNFVII